MVQLIGMGLHLCPKNGCLWPRMSKHGDDSPFNRRGGCDLFDAKWKIFEHIVLFTLNSSFYGFRTSQCTNLYPPYCRSQNDMLEMQAWPVVGCSLLGTPSFLDKTNELPYFARPCHYFVWPWDLDFRTVHIQNRWVSTCQRNPYQPRENRITANKPRLCDKITLITRCPLLKRLYV